jgi:glycosyltransferase involved in cell wall biosynthesis
MKRRKARKLLTNYLNPWNMKKLLIVDQHQFGYLTDTYKYCCHLRDTWDITVVCWDYDSKKVTLEGIRVVYVSREGGKPRRLARFIRAAKREVDTGGHDIVFCVYFPGCSLLRAGRKGLPIIMDIRTGSDRGGAARRRFDDELLRLESRVFERVTIVSESLRRKLRLPLEKCHLLPLGGDAIDIPPKTFDGLRLFYVGTLFRRDIHKTVEGIDRVYREREGEIDVTYDIVGDGLDEEKDELVRAIGRSACGDRVKFHGPIPNAELRPFLERCNVGVAFIPLEDYYQCQPSTKVFEYLLSGMPVLATSTDENRTIITGENGVLFDDTAVGFAEGVRSLLKNLSGYESSRLKETVREYEWTRIVKDNLNTYLTSVLGMDLEEPAKEHA